mmetsp:Transcript_73871/g.205396  ORF Transcript_73871/g.205396 Transcript_73871/m.205396 type:complete len:85 (-) Transcript_73871:33-287(-)
MSGTAISAQAPYKLDHVNITVKGCTSVAMHEDNYLWQLTVMLDNVPQPCERLIAKVWHINKTHPPGSFQVETGPVKVFFRIFFR